MRTLLLAMATAVGIGLAGTSATLGAAATGSVLTGQAATETLVVKVGHCRYSRWRPWCGGHGWRWSRRR
jgi:hypothetical protein